MLENSNVIAFEPEDYRLDEHGAVKPITGLMFERILVDDPDTGMTVARIRYPKGFTVPLHSHHCAHGYYILKGTLCTSEGNYGPGSFVWFKEGAPMIHGAGEEDVEAIAFANKPFDLTFLDPAEEK